MNIPLVAPLRSRLQVEVASYPDWFVFFEIFVNGEYKEVLEYFDKLHSFKGKAHIMDLGCNVGYFTLYIADHLVHRKQDFEIYAIDGNIEMCRQFQSRMLAQQEPHLVNRVTIEHGLVGHTAGFATFLTGANHTLSYINDDGQGPVDYKDLNTVFPGETIDLLKCDIEGSEEDFIVNYEVLLRRTNLLVAEFHTERIDYERCLRLLRGYGFNFSYLTTKELVHVGVFTR